MRTKHKKGKGIKGIGSLERKKNGIYIWRIVVNGKRMPARSTGTTNWDEACKKRLEFARIFQAKDNKERIEIAKAKIANLDDEIEQIKQNENNIKIKDLYYELFDSVNAPVVVGRTHEHYYYILNCFQRWCEFNKIYNMKDVDRDIAESFLKYLSKDEKKGNSTYNQYLAILKKTWRILMPSAHIKENPFNGFGYKEKIVVKKDILTGDEIIRLMFVIKDKDIQTQILFLLGIYTGMRLEDCCTLKVSEIDFATNRIVRVAMKTRRVNQEPMRIYIHPLLKRVLMKVNWSIKNPDDYVIPDYAEDYRSYAISRKVRKIFDEAKIISKNKDGKVVKGFHSFRVKFISDLHNSGSPIAAIQKLVSHKTPMMNLYYYRQDDDQSRIAIQGLPNYEEVAERSLIMINPSVKFVPIDIELYDKIMVNKEISFNENLKRIVSNVD